MGFQDDHDEEIDNNGGRHIPAQAIRPVWRAKEGGPGPVFDRMVSGFHNDPLMASAPVARGQTGPSGYGLGGFK